MVNKLQFCLLSWIKIIFLFSYISFTNAKLLIVVSEEFTLNSSISRNVYLWKITLILCSARILPSFMFTGHELYAMFQYILINTQHKLFLHPHLVFNVFNPNLSARSTRTVLFHMKVSKMAC